MSGPLESPAAQLWQQDPAAWKTFISHEHCIYNSLWHLDPPGRLTYDAPSSFYESLAHYKREFGFGQCLSAWAVMNAQTFKFYILCTVSGPAILWRTWPALLSSGRPMSAFLESAETPASLHRAAKSEPE